MAQIQSFTHLKDKPHSDKALATLQRVASLVKPIMRSRGWILPVLSEFFPSDPSLQGMNVNHGQKIYLRLRPHYAPDRFLQEEDLIGTMLHELTHNVHGPHDEKFYKYLSELENEYYTLRGSGYNGEGFYSEGKRLGQGVSHNAPISQAKSKAAVAAEKRKAISGVMKGSGQRLGGPSRTQTKSPRELAAEAAERRTRDDKACGSLSEKTIEAETQRAIEESILDIPDIDVPPSPSLPIPLPLQNNVANPGPSRNVNTTNGGPIRNKPTRGASGSKKRVNSNLMGSSADRDLDWACPICTLLNRSLALQCDACGMNKPVDSDIGWVCVHCGQGENLREWWTCKQCGRMKSEVLNG